LRPARWVITKNGYITLASEIGVWGYQPEDGISKGRVGPGQMRVIDTQTGKVLDTQDVNNHLKRMRPYREWLRENSVRLQGSRELEEYLCDQGVRGDVLEEAQIMFMATFAERDQLLRPIAESGEEAVGSVGDDTQMAVLSREVGHVSDYFRQEFA